MKQDLEHIRQKLAKVPDYWQQGLLEFLSDPKRLQQIKHMLQSSCLMLEGGGYQMPIHSVEELDAVIAILGESLLV